MNFPAKPNIAYKQEPRCSVCTARDLQGKMMRDEIDAQLAGGMTYGEIQAKLARVGIYISTQVIGNHVKKHAPFIKKALSLGSKTSKKLRISIEKQVTDAATAIQRIVNIGDKMVENWVEGSDDPRLQMPVTERLYVEALKEQGRHGTKTTMDMEMEDMDRSLFGEAQVIDKDDQDLQLKEEGTIVNVPENNPQPVS